MSDLDLVALRILRDALDAEPGERERFVSERCGKDAALRECVETMLRGVGDGDDAPPPADALVGERLGPFRVTERIGRGGMGVVYRGEREGADFAQTVAIKLIRRGFDFDDVQARFLRERRILARLNHPNLARFIDGGVAPDGRPWFALEYVDGDAITRWCDAHSLDVRERVRLFLDVCAAVQYAHSQLVVHRDLKPGNILVGGDGTVRLLDFGIARLLEDSDDAPPTLTTVGSGYALTPEYAAPEQFARAAAGVGADVYSLGVILYELIAGATPYTLDRHDLAAAERTVRESPPEPLTQAIARGEPGKPDATARLAARRTSAHAYRALVRGDLSRILGKALAKEPERRYASVEAFAGDLSRWLAGAPVRVSGNGFGYRLGKFVKRNRVAVGIASVLALGLVATSVFALRAAWSERIQRDAAIAEAARVSAVRDYTMLMFREAAEQGRDTKTTARDVLKRSAESLFARFAGRPAEGQEIASNLADLYLQIGDVEGAVPLLERLIAWPGIEANPEVLARARYNLAQAELARGNAARSRDLFDAARAYWAGDPARHGVALSESHVMQARFLRAERRFDEAIAVLEQGIVQRRRLVGDDREVGAAFNTLALALMEAGRYEDAIAKANEGLRLAERLGDDTIALALISNRGNAALQLRRYDEAIVDFAHVLELRRELFGRSAETAVSITNLVLVKAQAGKAGGTPQTRQEVEADIPLLEEGYEMAREFSGEAAHLTMMARTALADTRVLAGRPDEAEPLVEEGLRLALAHHGDTSLPTGMAWRARGNLRAAQHRDAEAREDLAHARAVFERMGKGGEVHLATVEALLELLDGRARK